MYIINEDCIDNCFKCNKQVMEYLVFKCHLPLLSSDENSYYFATTDKLKEALKKMPFSLKIVSWVK